MKPEIRFDCIGKEDFYRSLGFRQMKTGMALFKNGKVMADKGFTD